MVAGRRAVSVHESGSWVFNKMADVYAARPPYPAALVEALATRARAYGGRVGDLGAGTGRLALPLAACGLEVVAVEPASRMLDVLRDEARGRGLGLRTVHAAAEATSLPAASLDLAVVADAVHFMDAGLLAEELRRVLGPRGALAIVTSELGSTPFMRAIRTIMEDAAPRRPRNMSQAITQIFRATGVRREPPFTLRDEVPVDEAHLEAILRSISFIGPAMNAERFAAFRERIRAVPGPRVWTRELTVHAGRRGVRARALA
jgi:SAM-dependent methyltransferase